MGIVPAGVNFASQEFRNGNVECPSCRSVFPGRCIHVWECHHYICDECRRRFPAQKCWFCNVERQAIHESSPVVSDLSSIDPFSPDPDRYRPIDNDSLFIKPYGDDSDSVDDVPAALRLQGNLPPAQELPEQLLELPGQLPLDQVAGLFAEPMEEEEAKEEHVAEPMEEEAKEEHVAVPMEEEAKVHTPLNTNRDLGGAGSNSSARSRRGTGGRTGRNR